MSNQQYTEILERAKRIKQSLHQRNPCMIKPGDILLFERNTGDKISKILSWLLRQLDGCWDGWGWHMGYVFEVSSDGSMAVVEAKIGHGVKLIKYPDADSLGEVRAYRWIDDVDLTVLENFTLARLGCAYDLGCYFWTGMQLLIRRFSDRLIKRIENDKYTCWELVSEMAQAMGKPLQPVPEYPLITDMTRILSGVRIL